MYLVGLVRPIRRVEEGDSRWTRILRVLYIYTVSHYIPHLLVRSSHCDIMSKGTVHHVAAGGFGTGTNDLVRLHPTFD